MLSWSHWQARWVERLFYINDIITSLQKPKNNKLALWWIIILNYVTQLGEKNYWRKSRSVRVFSKNCASNFFWSDGKGVATENLKLQFITKQKSKCRHLEMKLVKWSKQIIDARNTWTRSNFCADEWDNELIKKRCLPFKTNIFSEL